MKHTSIACLGIIAGLLGSPALAEQTPRSGGYDSHVKVVAYNPMNVVRVIGSTTNSTEIIFSPRERVTQVAVGDDQAWIALPAGNLLFIQPTLLRLSTNMTVVTESEAGGSRSYQFRLLAQKRGEDGASPAIYALHFTYPADERRARDRAAALAKARAQEKASEARLEHSWAQGPRNWRYVAQGSTLIQPTAVSDNGRQTAFRFPGNMRIPTIYTIAPDGSETIVPYTMDGDHAVVQTTAQMFVLRDGQEALRIINQGFDPVGRNPGTGTGMPELTRTIRSAS